MPKIFVQPELRERDTQSKNPASDGISATALATMVPIGVLLLAFALRLYRLGVDSLWYDETFSVYVSGLDLVSLTRHTAGDIHPPLYYYVLHFWMDLAGRSEFALGFLSLFFGVLLVAAVYRFALRLFDGPVALTSALLVAISPFNLWYSQEVRMYTLATLLLLAALWYILEAIDDAVQSPLPLRRERVRVRVPGPILRAGQPWLGYAIFAALGLYVLYYVAFALIAANLVVLGWWLLSPQANRSRAFLTRWILAQAGAIALYLPWLPSAIRQILSPAVPPWREFVDLGQVLKEAWSALSLGQASDPAETWPFLLLIAALYGLGLFAAARLRGRLQVAVLAGFVWGPVLLIFLVSLVTPLFFVRYVFTYSPLFYMTLALGLVAVARFFRPLGILSLLVVLGTFATSAQAYFHADAYAPDDFRSAVRYIEERWGPGDAILLDAGYIYPAFLYYFKQAEPGWRGRLTDYPGVANIAADRPVVLQMGSIDGSPQLGWGDPKADFYPTTRDEVARSLQAASEKHPRLWLLRAYDTVTDPQGFVRDWLDANATLTDDIMVQGSSNARVQRYLVGTGRGRAIPSGPTSGQPLVNFDNALALSAFGPSSPTVKSGETAFLRFEWLRQGGFEKEVRAYVAMMDDRGRVWQQQDNVPVGRLYPSSKWPAGAALPDLWQFKIPVGTPPGDYKLVAGAYLAASGQTLEVRANDGKPLGPQAVVGTLSVEANPGVSLPAGLSGIKAEFGSGLGLVDFKLSTKRIKPGESLQVDLLWKALSAPEAEYTASLDLRDERGDTIVRQDGMPGEGRYPISRWQKGEVIGDKRDLAIDAGAPDGDFRLYLSLDGKDYLLGKVAVRGRPRSFEAPKSMAHPVSIRLGDTAELLGYDVEPKSSSSGAVAELQTGQRLKLVLYWRSLKRTDISYTVFTQILDGANIIQGQRDRPPGDGTLPTSSWLAGEIIADAYEVQLKPGASPGDLLLVVGMYDAKTGQRLPVALADGSPAGDAHVLGKVIIKP